MVSVLDQGFGLETPQSVLLADQGTEGQLMELAAYNFQTYRGQRRLSRTVAHGNRELQLNTEQAFYGLADAALISGASKALCLLARPGRGAYPFLCREMFI